MMRMSRRALLGAAASLPFLHAQARAARAPDTLTFGLSSYPPNILPWVQTGTASITVKNLLYRGLLSYGPDGRVRGELAESWERDGNAWRFKLREAVFHNGQPVTAADVKWTIEQVAAERSTAYLRAEMQEVEAVETPDPRTVRIVLKHPNATFPQLVAGPHLAIIARGSEANSPVGAGPYTLTGQERGVRFELTAFDRYYKPGLPKTRHIRFVNYQDENLRVAALQAGDIDIIEYVPWPAMAAIEADPRLKLDNTNGPFMALSFNGRNGPFRDARVRRAVGFAVKREDIVRSAFFGRGAPLAGLPLTPGTEFYDEGRANLYRYDPERAKSLLTEAGVGNGFACTLLSTAQYNMHQSTAEVVQQHLAAVGVQVQLNLPDWATRVTMGNRGQYEFCVQGQTAEFNDPDGVSQLIDGELPLNVARSVGIATPRIHELLAAGRAEFDVERRRAIYAELEQRTFEDAPFVGLAWRAQGYAMARDVQGFKNLPGALTFYSGFTLEETSIAG